MKHSVSTDDLELLPHRFQVMFALFCAKQVKHKWKDELESVKSIVAVEKWLEGKATIEECKAICTPSWVSPEINIITYTVATIYAVGSVASSAAYAHACAVCALSLYPIVSRGDIEIVEAQWKYYNELLYFDDIAEKILLKDTNTDSSDDCK